MRVRWLPVAAGWAVAAVVFGLLALAHENVAGNLDVGLESADLGDTIELSDDDLPYVHPQFKSQSDRRVAVPLPASVTFDRPPDPTEEQLRTMRIGVASLAAPLTREHASKVAKYVYSMCLMFQSFRQHTRFQNVEYVLITRNTSWAFTDETHRIVRACNMRVVERPLAIKTKYVTDPYFKTVLHDKALAGIGLLDYDFLWPWSFDQYDKVLVVDSDTFFTKSIDHLFTPDVDMVFTNGPKSHVNGGMQVIRPNKRTFLDMRNRIIAPNAYHRETGWYNHGFIPPDQYGSATLQGFLTYYFTAVNTNVLQVPRCLYNYQFDHLSVAETSDCDAVYMFHFTACPKPVTKTVAQFRVIMRRKNKPPICECAFMRYKEFQRKVMEELPELGEILRQHGEVAV
ncbi:hypothetical protein PTSG_06274 [Salpingoeca rosetta]|uniref:Uncharacterized protein n=1 Tax=Salpingoeca rosetta (strain ATCC 50818 / BSB-021) TaxID=946362 RepID=F2UCF8_SALR5|nr:uncharacterized protein PTSG_06274 [Salpingoeca rosetta]EGD74265.1 hypothetical protein PTSG_06274 [Salpingoeca rosetta]|eukprot:XP_004993165.1 hypothetical protein PTSG_06274 [Salpingoeca rosetta]